MPKATNEVQDSYETITRPVILDVMRQMGKLLKLPKDTEVMFLGASDQAAQTGSTLNYEGETSNFPYHGKLKIEAVENYVEDRILNEAVYRREFLPIFLDAKLGVRITPVYSATEVVVSVIYRAANRVVAERFRDDIKMRTTMLRKENLHELTYHYAVPSTYLNLLQVIHGMREAVAPYNEDFSTWVRAHLDGRATNVTTLIGTEPQLVIPEHQTQVLGWFDFTAAPEPAQKDGEGGAFDMSFEYRMVYDKVIGCVIEWPLVIHNQLIDLPYRGNDQNASGDLPSDPSRQRRYPSLSRHFFDYFTRQYPCPCDKLDGIRSPAYDDWTPDTTYPDTSSVFTAIVAVDLEHRQNIVNLNELGDYTIDHNVMDFLVTEAPYLTHYGRSIVHLSLFQGDRPMTDGGLSVDAQGNVITTLTLDPRERYHLRIALVNNLYLLDNEAFDRFRMSGPAALKILLTLQQRLPGGAFIPNLLGGRVVPRKVLDDIAKRINSTKTPYFTGTEYRMLTVGNFVITTRRADDATHASQTVGTGGNTADPGTGDGYTVPGCGDGFAVQPGGEPPNLR